jgi:hypothetical protein
MKYWGFFLAKCAVAVGLFWVALQVLAFLMPEPKTFLYHRVAPFGQDLSWTTALLMVWLLFVGVLYIAVWDQRRRCRTCLRVLMMPLDTGNWSKATLFSPPKTESICPYGHGTLEQPQVHTTGAPAEEWHPHGSIWEELEHLETGRK